MWVDYQRYLTYSDFREPIVGWVNIAFTLPLCRQRFLVLHIVILHSLPITMLFSINKQHNYRFPASTDDNFRILRMDTPGDSPRYSTSKWHAKEIERPEKEKISSSTGWSRRKNSWFICSSSILKFCCNSILIEYLSTRVQFLICLASSTSHHLNDNNDLDFFSHFSQSQFSTATQLISHLNGAQKYFQMSSTRCLFLYGQPVQCIKYRGSAIPII